MKFPIRFLIYSIALISFAVANAQNNANVLLSKVYTKLQKARDYSVEANIKVDMPFIRMLPIDVKIFYKQKDKFHVESKSIAIVPRQGFDQVSKILADSNSYTAMIQGEERLGTVPTNIVNVIPLVDTSDVILGKFWIDINQNVVVKSQLTTRSSGTIVTEYTYGTQVSYGLPDKMIFTVDVKKFRMPKSFTAEMNKNAATEKNDKEKEKKNGNITIVMTNYQVNKGIPDSVFKK